MVVERRSRLLGLRRKGSGQWHGCRFGCECGRCPGVEWSVALHGRVAV